jgi:hypothetical protein
MTERYSLYGEGLCIADDGGIPSTICRSLNYYFDVVKGPSHERP